MMKYAAAGVCALLLAGCSFHFEAGDFGHYSGTEVAQQINEHWRPMALAESPLLHVGEAACPQSLDIADGRTAYCTVPVNGQRMRVRVSLVNDAPFFKGAASLLPKEI